MPAAQARFISKSRTRPSRMLMYLESWPPISKTVSTSGSMNTAARAWAVISFRTRSARTRSAIMDRPEPVTPAPRTRTRAPISRPSSPRPRSTASMGREAVRR